MEYNTTRSKLCMPEYGRNVQGMAEHLLTIKDPAQRLKNAEVIIDLMAILNPQLKAVEDYKHKLWDHLHQMTDFKLEVDGPYPKPTAEELYKKPEPIPYPQTRVKHRHLGRNLEEFLKKGKAEKDPEKKRGYTQHVGYYMKLAYTNWHKEPVHDDMIRAELAQLSDGSMIYEPGGYKVHFDPRAPAGNDVFKQPKKKKYGNKGGQQYGFQGGGNNANPNNANGSFGNKNRKYKNKNKNNKPPQQ